MHYMSSLFSLDLLEKPYAAQVLLLLHQEGAMNKGLIYEKFNVGSVTLQDRIRELSVGGLVVETKETKR